MPQTRRLVEVQPPLQLLVLRQELALKQLRDTLPLPSLPPARACGKQAAIGID
jgi:hypothetical protein